MLPPLGKRGLLWLPDVAQHVLEYVPHYLCIHANMGRLTSLAPTGGLGGPGEAWAMAMGGGTSDGWLDGGAWRLPYIAYMCGVIS